VAPAIALKLSRLVGVPPAGESSLAATAVNAETDEPVKTPRMVSKLLPEVETVTLPEAGAVQDHHADAPPAFPAMGGSPASLVAPVLYPVTVTAEPLITIALAKSLFTGAVGGVWPA
jgi:hypothetical protein